MHALNPLLDTHSLIWFALDDPRVSARARAMFEDPDIRVMILAGSGRGVMAMTVRPAPLGDDPET